MEASCTSEERATSSLINNLALLLQCQGRLGDAEPLYREALAGRRKGLGDRHRDTLVAVQNLADLLRHRGRLGDAEPLFREAVAGKRETSRGCCRPRAALRRPSRCSARTSRSC